MSKKQSTNTNTQQSTTQITAEDQVQAALNQAAQAQGKTGVTGEVRNKLRILISDHIATKDAYEGKDDSEYWAKLTTLGMMMSGLVPFNEDGKFEVVKLPDEDPRTPVFTFWFVCSVNDRREAKHCLRENLKLNYDPHAMVHEGNKALLHLSVPFLTLEKAQRVFDANKYNEQLKNGLFMELIRIGEEPKKARKVSIRNTRVSRFDGQPLTSTNATALVKNMLSTESELPIIELPLQKIEEVVEENTHEEPQINLDELLQEENVNEENSDMPLLEELEEENVEVMREDELLEN